MRRARLLREDLESTRSLALLGMLALAAMAVAFYWNTAWRAPFPRDATTLAVGRDFLNFWMYGRAALHADPGRFYDPHVYNHALQRLVGAGYPLQTWSYPPTVMLVAAPFGVLGYRAALLIWTLLGAGILYALALRTLPARHAALLVFLSPAAIFCLLSGQNSFFTLAVLIAAFAWRKTRPVAAGILIGLLTLKPQLGLLLPVMLVAGRHWRALWAAGLCAILLALLTAALYGPDVWIDYVRLGLPAQNQVPRDTHIFAAQMMPTIFMNVHLAGLGYAASMAVQGLFALAAGATVYWAFRHRAAAGPERLLALFLLCSAAATPYLMPYDALALAYAAILLLSNGLLDAQGRVLAKLVWWMPFVQMALGPLHIAGAALFAPLFAGWLALRMREPGEVFSANRFGLWRGRSAG